MSSEAPELAADREERLAGSGIPLSPAFRIVLQHLQRNPATPAELAELIRRDKLMLLNRGRIITTWGDGTHYTPKAGRAASWDSISSEALAADLLAQLRYRELAEPNGDGSWHLTEVFDPRKRYVLLTGAGTHIRLSEAEERASEAKLSEARLLLVTAAQLVKEAGGDTRDIKAFFAGLQRLLSEDPAEAKRIEDSQPGKMGNKPRVITPDQLPDLPNLFITCVKCSQQWPQTREYWEQYLSNPFGSRRAKEWHWRKDCKDCRSKRKKYTKIIPQVKQGILDFMAENHYPPTVRQLSRRLGIHANAVRRAWQELHKTEEDFPPCPEALTAK